VVARDGSRVRDVGLHTRPARRNRRRAGGAFGPNVLPDFYAAVGRWITPGIGTEGVRSIVYFSGTGLGQPALALALYSIIGVGLLFVFSKSRVASPEIEKSEPLPVF
jgi:hypothetical protein